MSATDSSTLVLVRSTAVVGLGLVSGLMLSIPVWTWPALYRPDSTLTPAQRLSFWSTLYSQGKRTMVSVLPVTTTLLAYAAYAAKVPATYLPASWVARHRRGILGTAAATTFSIVVFTVVAMEGLNGSLKKLEQDAKVNGSPVLPAHDTIIRTKWAKLHLVRCTLGLAAFAASVTELALA